MNTDPVHVEPNPPDWAALQRQAQAWVREFATGRPTAADMARVRHWRALSAEHERAWTQACSDWKALGRHAQAFTEQYPRLAHPRPVRADRRLFLGAAASALGTLAVVGMVRPPLGLWPSWSEWRADYRTATGEQREFALAGQIHLALNTQTSIAVRDMGKRPRFELVAGEAAVSALGDTACEVLAGDGRVLLTQGEVEVRRLPAGQVRVRCTSGSSEVWHPTRRVALSAGEQVTYDQGGIDDRARPAPASEWRHGMVAFDDQPLADVVDEINRYRPGRVVLMNDELARRRLSARVSVHALDEVIAHIQRLYGAQVRRVGDLVILA
ncbi:FecR family protein [Bordetella genomosp. 13]|uniref:Iron dicitrate transport regulator FecR n=1 Tax=Bordetella genomosp. 13 TaxID=463040 RepID=A0A1W6ZC80_9BORD|nr:FecR domain-containing protein [Bordetella genomosp. 13]ARP94961.1 iron dicitrate transport regulator FecR [Bordetella genomosp. 13]